MNKRILFPILFLLFFINGSAQNYLTNGQVYNYNVGDVFEVEDYALPYGNLPPVYFITVITGKSYSADSATIYYTDNNVSYELHCMFCAWTVTTNITGVSVTNLTSPAQQTNFGNTCPLKDTVYYDNTNYCGRKVWERYPDPACLDTGFEDVTTYSWLVEGCGGAYLNYFDPSCICGEVEQLIYYKKGADSCGSEYISTGISEPALKNIQLTIYPNPSTSFLNISSSTTIYWYDVMDMSGRVIISASFPQNKQIGIESLARGSYLLGLYTKNYGRISRQFEKE